MHRLLLKTIHEDELEKYIGLEETEVREKGGADVWGSRDRHGATVAGKDFYNCSMYVKYLCKPPLKFCEKCILLLVTNVYINGLNVMFVYNAF